MTVHEKLDFLMNNGNGNSNRIVACDRFSSYTFNEEGKYRVFAVANKDGWASTGLNIIFNDNGGSIIETILNKTHSYANSMSNLYAFNCYAVVGSSITYNANSCDGSVLYLYIERLD